MPVWHEQTRTAREAGELVVLGVVQEQHPDRARLFAQWHGIDWPILWDPFNVTGATAVPLHRGIDEHGTLRWSGRSYDAFEAEFLVADFPPPARAPGRLPIANELAEVRLGAPEDRRIWRALSALLWRPPDTWGSAIDALRERVASEPGDAATGFRLGVALRMRHDSELREPGDFQGAIDAWTRALALDPNQYVWRRRIQQVGPRLDKPYPFYDWIETAQRDIEARGETPVALAAPLSGAEIVGRGGDFVPADEGGESEPDPEARIHRAPLGALAVESAVAFDTSPDEGGARRPVARVHLAFRPGPSVSWSNEGEPMIVWLGAGGALPAGWELDARLLEHAGPAEATSREERRLELEVRLPAGASGVQRLRGYALFDVCEADGRCVRLRRDFETAFSVR